MHSQHNHSRARGPYGGNSRYDNHYQPQEYIDHNWDNAPDNPQAYDERSRGDRYSSQMQPRNEPGHFTSQRDDHQQSRWADYDDGQSRRYEENRSYQGDHRNGYGQQTRAGYSSANSQERDEDGRFSGSSNSGSQRSNSYNNGWWSDSNDSGRDIVDSAGRHYSRESWERAQQGRARGGSNSRTSSSGRSMQSSRH